MYIFDSTAPRTWSLLVDKRVYVSHVEQYAPQNCATNFPSSFTANVVKALMFIGDIIGFQIMQLN